MLLVNPASPATAQAVAGDAMVANLAAYLSR